jgi:hypothetical protein
MRPLIRPKVSVPIVRIGVSVPLTQPSVQTAKLDSKRIRRYAFGPCLFAGRGRAGIIRGFGSFRTRLSRVEVGVKCLTSRVDSRGIPCPVIFRLYQLLSARVQLRLFWRSDTRLQVHWRDDSTLPREDQRAVARPHRFAHRGSGGAVSGTAQQGRRSEFQRNARAGRGDTRDSAGARI